MADEAKKPRKDLRARLGKTIAPKTQGGAAPVAPPPGAAGAAAPVPAPPIEAPKPAAVAPPAGGGIAPPPSAVKAPPISAPMGIPGADLAPPPFARPAPEPPRPAPPSDPFAASAPGTQQQVVRIEFDDKPVAETEVGRRSRVFTIVALVIGIIAGGAVGFGGGNMIRERELFNATVQDGRSIYNKINEASTPVGNVQRHINAAVESATGAGGTTPSVNYAEIEALAGIERPFRFEDFIGRNYNAFQAGTVADLFAYAANVVQIWERITRINAITAAPRRPELDRTAAELAEQAGGGVRMGAVPRLTEGGIVVSIGFLQITPGATPEAPPTITMRPSRQPGAPGIAVTPYVAGEDQAITDSPQFVMEIDMATSPVFSSQQSAFREYLGQLRELKILVDSTVEIQGRILQSMGQVAALNEV